MKQIQETPTHLIYLDYFKGKQVRVIKNKATGEIFFDMDDVAKVLGYADKEEMLKDPEVIKSLNQADAAGKPTVIEVTNRNHIN